RDERAREDRQAAEHLDECGHPGRRLRQRRTYLFQKPGESRRPPTELGPPVSQEAVPDHEAERQWRPLSQKRLPWQFEHFATRQCASEFETCRPRKSRMSRAIRFPSLSSAKCPASSRWNSIVLRSRLYGSAPAAVKIWSFLPHTISIGGWYFRKYSCHCG